MKTNPEFQSERNTHMDAAAIRILAANMDAGRDHYRFFTFELTEGRRMTIAALTKDAAIIRVRSNYPEDVTSNREPLPDVARCACESKLSFHREGGVMICARFECAGLIGVS